VKLVLSDLSVTCSTTQGIFIIIIIKYLLVKYSMYDVILDAKLRQWQSFYTL